MADKGDAAVLVRYDPAPGTLTPGQRTVARCTDQGILLVAGGGVGPPILVVFDPPSSYDTAPLGAVNSGIISAAPRTLLDLNGLNRSAAGRYFMLFDAIALPVNGTRPVTVQLVIPAGMNFSISFADSMGRRFTNGIVWASSTTLDTLTLSPAGDMTVNAQHRA